MSKIIKITGIVIAENIVSDSDKMLTILTSEYGKINAIAKQSRRLKSSLLSGTQFLCVSKFTLYKASKTFRINEAIPIEMFYNIYEDYDKLLLATKITKIINAVALENYFEHNLFKLFLITLQLISNNKTTYNVNKENKNKNENINKNRNRNRRDIKSDIFIESVFKLRLGAQLGFEPDLGDLAEIIELKNSNKEKEYYELIFDIDDGRVIIIDENIKIKNGIRIQKETFYSLKYILNSELNKIYNFSVSDRILVELARIADKYFEKCIC